MNNGKTAMPFYLEVWALPKLQTKKIMEEN